MAEHNIAIIRGDGIGVDVVEEGLKALNAVAKRFDITFKFTEFPWGTDYYFKNDAMMPSATTSPSRWLSSSRPLRAAT